MSLRKNDDKSSVIIVDARSFLVEVVVIVVVVVVLHFRIKSFRVLRWLILFLSNPVNTAVTRSTVESPFEDILSSSLPHSPAPLCSSALVPCRNWPRLLSLLLTHCENPKTYSFVFLHHSSLETLANSVNPGLVFILH